MRNDKGILIAAGAVVALLALSMVVRLIAFSQYGFSGGWMLFTLPVGGIGIVLVLLRLGVLNLGDRSRGTTVSWPVAPPAPAAPTTLVPQRLHDLEALRASGVISDAEFAARRQQIISGI